MSTFSVVISPGLSANCRQSTTTSGGRGSQDRGTAVPTWVYALVTVRVMANSELLTRFGRLSRLKTRCRQSTKWGAPCSVLSGPDHCALPNWAPADWALAPGAIGQ